MSTVKSGAPYQSFAERPGTGRRYQGPWGSLEVSDVASARRSGLTRYRLEVFPPGTNFAERHQLTRFRQWRLWGAFAALMGEFLLGGIWHGWQVPLCLAGIYLAGLLVGARATRRLRTATHALHVATATVGGSTYVEGDLDLLERCVTEFERLEGERVERHIEPVEYESVWTRIYVLLGSTPQA
jgi:hypothetical protein